MLRNIFRSRCFFMPSHSEGEAFEKDGTRLPADGFGKSFYSGVSFQNIVAVYLHGLYSVAYSFIDKLLHGKLFARRSGEAVAIIFDDEDYRQIPNSGHVHGLMEIAFAGSAIT